MNSASQELSAVMEIAPPAPVPGDAALMPPPAPCPAPVPCVLDREVFLYKPAHSIHFDCVATGTAALPRPALAWRYMDQWPHRAVTLSRLVDRAFELTGDDLVNHAFMYKSTGASIKASVKPDLKSVYGMFGTDRAVDAEKRRLALHDVGEMFQAAQPEGARDALLASARGLCVRGTNATGTLRIRRPKAARLFIGDPILRSHETTSTHTVRALPPIITVDAASSTLGAYDPAPETLFSLSSNLGVFREFNDPALIVDHNVHQGGHGEMDVHVAGNVEYEVSFYKANFALYVVVDPAVTALTLHRDLNGSSLRVWGEVAARDLSLSQSRPVENLDFSAAAFDRLVHSLGIDPRGSFGGPEMQRLVRQLRQPHSDLEVLRSALTVGRDGVVFLRGLPLVLRSKDDCVYYAFSTLGDPAAVEQRLPVCVLRRRPAEELERMNAFATPFELELYAVTSDDTAALRHSLTECHDAASVMQLLNEHYGLPTLSHHLKQHPPPAPAPVPAPVSAAALPPPALPAAPLPRRRLTIDIGRLRQFDSMRLMDDVESFIALPKHAAAALPSPPLLPQPPLADPPAPAAVTSPLKRKRDSDAESRSLKDATNTLPPGKRQRAACPDEVLPVLGVPQKDVMEFIMHGTGTLNGMVKDVVPLLPLPSDANDALHHDMAVNVAPSAKAIPVASSTSGSLFDDMDSL